MREWINGWNVDQLMNACYGFGLQSCPAKMRRLYGIFSIEVDEDRFLIKFFSCKFFHDPNDILNLKRSLRTDLNPFNMAVTLAIGFNEIVSNKRIEMFGIEKRKCRFPAEITSNRSYPLGFYTQNFCHVECNIKAAIKLCGCQPFFYKIGKKQLFLLKSYSISTSISNDFSAQAPICNATELCVWL